MMTSGLITHKCSLFFLVRYGHLRAEKLGIGRIFEMNQGKTSHSAGNFKIIFFVATLITSKDPKTIAWYMARAGRDSRPIGDRLKEEH